MFLFLISSFPAIALDLNFNNLFDTTKKTAPEPTCATGQVCSSNKGDTTCDVEKPAKDKNDVKTNNAKSSEEGENGNNEETEQDIMESALTLLEDSQELWVKG